MGRRDYGDPYADRRSPTYYMSAEEKQVFKTLRDNGVAKARVDVWGGNDEGGAGSIYLYDKEGKQTGYINYDEVVFFARTPKRNQIKMRTEVPNVYPDPETNKKYARQVPVKGKTITGEEAEKIRNVLEGPVEDEYGGWGGQSISGYMEWDTETGKTDWHVDHGVW